MQDQAPSLHKMPVETFAGRAIHLIPGQYVIVPSLNVRDLLDQKYKLLDYALVPSATTSAEKDEAMTDTLPDSAYATVSVGVSPSTA